tara:strand:+ start:684 stop:1175 length:492 start_codon:yes stop_codon:yes gene_type:complete
MSNTEKWLIKYDSIWNEINNKPIFQSYLSSLEDYQVCIKAFIEYGNKIKNFLKIYNWKIEIIDSENIKNYLYIILSCIISFGRYKHNKYSSQIYKESRELFEKKNNDYGDAFMDYTTIGILVRLGDKIRRTENLFQKNTPNFESIDDTLFDSFNYIILALILI